MSDDSNGGPNAPLDIDKEALKARLRTLWEGDIPLFQTFWFYFIGVLVVLNILASIDSILGGLFSLCGVAWGAFMIMPILRSADKYTGDRNLAIAAKGVAILVAAIIVLRLLAMAA